MKNSIKFLLCSILILSACQAKSVEEKSGNKQSDIDNNSVIVTPSPNTETLDPKYIISSSGIGEAKLGMTLGELKQIVDKDTKFELKSSFMVDINAIAVSKMDEIQYYILFSDNNNPQDSDSINYLMTQNSNYYTEEGVKVGTKIKHAETIYGDANLSYNINYESREYINFLDVTSDSNLSFRPNSAKFKSGFAGIYPQELKEYNQTKEYQDDAKISTIEVTCRLLNCP